MGNWNVVLTIQEHGYKQAIDVLRDFGTVYKTDFFNALVMQVDNPLQFLEHLHSYLKSLPVARTRLARVLPVTESFYFQSLDEFEARTKEKVEPWLSQLAGKTFHVRMHQCGFEGRLSSQNEEQFLDYHVIICLQERDEDTRSDFADPDFIIALEIVGQNSGLSIWGRAQRQRYALLKLD